MCEELCNASGTDSDTHRFTAVSVSPHPCSEFRRRYVHRSEDAATLELRHFGAVTHRSPCNGVSTTPHVRHVMLKARLTSVHGSLSGGDVNIIQYLATSLMEVGPGEVGDDPADVPAGQSPYSASQTLLPSAVTSPLTHCGQLSLVWAAPLSLIRHVTHANCLWCSLPIE